MSAPQKSINSTVDHVSFPAFKNFQRIECQEGGRQRSLPNRNKNIWCTKEDTD